MFVCTPEADDKEEKQQDREEEATRGRESEYGGCIGSSSMRRGLNHFYCNQMKEGTEAGGQKYFLAELGSQRRDDTFCFCCRSQEMASPAKGYRAHANNVQRPAATIASSASTRPNVAEMSSLQTNHSESDLCLSRYPPPSHPTHLLLSPANPLPPLLLHL